jgi:hypothetical protein
MEMEKKFMDRLIGKYCKIVTSEPGEETAHVVFGMLEDIDYDAGIVIIKSNPNLLNINMENIVAIKPKS